MLSSVIFLQNAHICHGLQNIIQVSGIGPTLWIIMESDLYPLLQANIMFKYAADINLLVPEHADVSLAVSHIKTWVDSNGVITNLRKTKELVLHYHHCNKYDLPQSYRETSRSHISE